MSFSKAKVKRFNETEAVVPPVGAYDPKLQDTSMSGSFLKSDRFRSDQDLSTSSVKSLESLQSDGSRSSFKLPQRTRSFSQASVEQNGKIRECENEIRRLLNEKSKYTKDQASKEEEIKKLDYKLQTAIRERTSLKASLVTYEKENKELRRTTDILKSKISALDTVEKKKDLSAEVVAVTEKLVRKDHEIDDLRIELFEVRRELEELVVASKEKDAELEKVKSEMNQTVLDVKSEHDAAMAKLSELEETNRALKESSEVMKDQLGEVIEKLMASEATAFEMKEDRSKLVNELAICRKELESKEEETTKVADDLRKENLVLLDRVEEQTNKRQFQERVLSLELDNAHQKLSSTETCTRALQDYKDALIGRVSSLKETIADLEGQQTIDMHTIKSLKVEVADLSSRLADKKKALLVSNSEITALREQIHELQNVHSEAIEKLAAMKNELCDCKVHEETLQGELLVTRLALQVAEGDIMEFRKCLTEIAANLDHEKEEVFNYKTLLEEHKREMTVKEQELKDLANKLQEEIGTKEVQISELTSEFNKQLEEQQTSIEEMNVKADLKDLEFKDRFDLLQREIDAKKIQIEELALIFENQLEKHKTEVEEMNREASRNEAEFKSRFEQLTSDIQTKDNQIATFSSKVDSITLSTYSLKIRLQEEETESTELRKKLNAKEMEIAEMMEKIVAIQADKQNLVESVAAVREVFEEQKKDITLTMDVAMKAVSDLKAAADIRETEFKSIKEVKAQLEKEIDSYAIREQHISKKNEELLSSLESKDLQMVDLERSISVLKEQTQVLVDDFKTKETDFESSKRSLEAQVQSKDNELVAALLKLQESHAAAENSLSSLRNNLRRMEAEKHDNEMLYFEMKNMRNILHDELRVAQRELNDTEAKLESTENTTSSLLQKIESLKSVNDIKEEQLKESSERVKELESDCSTKVKNLQMIESQLEKKRAEADHLNGDVQRLTKCVQDKEGEIAELRVIIEQNQQLANDKSLVDDLTTTMDELNRLLETSKEQQALIQEMHEERSQFEATLQQQKQEIQLHTATIEWYSDREKDLLREFDVLEAKEKDGEQEMKKVLAETQKAFSKLENQYQSYRERKESEGRQNEEMIQSLTNDYETRLKQVTDASETSYWRKLYEDLQVKVEPFMEQLNAYELERNLMMSKNQETMSDLVKLSEQYATLLGHQNHKQKIHYMTKLKEEVLTLKEENSKLRLDALKYKKSALRRDVPVSASRPSRPGDSVKRFHQPDKENNSTPLRDRNGF